MENEDTLMRRLDSTRGPQKSDTTSQFNQSAGSKLLQMMQFHQKDKIKNKKFRCNIEEIDKILEEIVPE